jgi:hypothetical protein
MEGRKEGRKEERKGGREAGREGGKNTIITKAPFSIPRDSEHA